MVKGGRGGQVGVEGQQERRRGGVPARDNQVPIVARRRQLESVQVNSEDALRAHPWARRQRRARRQMRARGASRGDVDDGAGQAKATVPKWGLCEP